ncbi:hypothetical protein ACTWQF_05910 [Streptomyces sp. 8N114]|uniref:hypothetical protein n=1 Tax=Streptomyces sp. 8N114 TaxID=3457419 RepID=UPI003FD1A4FF
MDLDLDLDAVADELYGLQPGDFTAARDARAQQARAAGERELAERIRGLRRPTAAAWASNLLVREEPEEARLLLELGEALRAAHRDLDGHQLRELSARQRQITAALARQARELTARAGRRISDDAQREVTETLHAALADPDAGREWAAGHLAKPLTAPVGFTGDLAESAAATAAQPPPKKQRADKARAAKAREQAREAERELRAREAEQRTAQTEADSAEERHRQAEQNVAEAREQLRQVEAELRAARHRLRQADRAVGKARDRAP